MEFSSCNMQLMYRKLIDAILVKGTHVGNTIELRNVMFTIPSIDNVIIPGRTDMAYAVGELCWYFDGDRELSFIQKFSKFWTKISDDGRTCNSAYGYILKEREGFDQIEKIIDLLKHDKYTRRAVLNINKANVDVITTKDEQCTIAIQFLIRNNELHTTVFMRSNDVIRGLPYDVLYFTTLAKYIAMRCNINYGTYTHIVTSLHVYIQDLNIINTLSALPLITKPKYNINVYNLVNNFRWICAYVRITKYDINSELQCKRFKVDVVNLAKQFNIIEEC